jgi:hypothetical protein
MKTYLFRLFIFSCCFLASCSSDSTEDNESAGTPYNDITLPFRYSIILKDKDGHVLSGGNKVDITYWEKDIRLIPYPPDSYREPLFSIRGDDERESRIVVATEFNEYRQRHVAMILELVEVRCAYAVPVELYHKYTYDTIRCDLKAVNDSVVCENISVNGILLWENDRNGNEEPCITLVKNVHTVAVGGLE